MKRSSLAATWMKTDAKVGINTSTLIDRSWYPLAVLSSWLYHSGSGSRSLSLSLPPSLSLSLYLCLCLSHLDAEREVAVSAALVVVVALIEPAEDKHHSTRSAIYSQTTSVLLKMGICVVTCVDWSRNSAI